MTEWREEVDDLLRAYAEYGQLLKIEAGLSMKRAKQKIVGIVDVDLISKHESVKRSLQSVSDSMTFSTPFAWIMYKFEAYKNEAQPIRTMRDFRVHCSKDGDICSKRFAFVNEQLTKGGQRSLLDTSYFEDSILLDALLKDRSIQGLINNSVFMSLWRMYEYNIANDRVAKWENYSSYGA